MGRSILGNPPFMSSAATAPSVTRFPVGTLFRTVRINSLMLELNGREPQDFANGKFKQRRPAISQRSSIALHRPKKKIVQKYDLSGIPEVEVFGMRVKPEFAEALLNLPQYRDVPYSQLVYRARLRLGLARLGSIKGIKVDSRVMAIAVLEAVKDATAFGMVG